MLAKLLLSFFGTRSAGTASDSNASSRRAIDAYLASHKLRKLHLGAGPGSPVGWLSTDAAPHSESVVRLDAAAPFPIDDGAFDYIYSEHLIEHMPWQAGAAMLKECRRVLKPGGTLRVATPDLAVLLALYPAPRDAAAERYVKWLIDHAIPGVHAYKSAFVINNAFRSWGHEFLYDADLLQNALTDAGLVQLRRCDYGESRDENLRRVECHGRNIGDEGIAAFETMVFEADAPGAASA